MKVGHIIDGLTVVDVKRVSKMNLIQFTKAVAEYIEQGYKIDVHSSRQIGLVLQCDLYKLESNLSGNVGSTGEVTPIGDSSVEDVKELQQPEGSESYNPEDVVLKINGVEVEGFNIEEVDEGVVSSETEVDVSEVEQTTPPVKKATRTKKQTT